MLGTHAHVWAGVKLRVGWARLRLSLFFFFKKKKIIKNKINLYNFIYF